MLPDSENKLKIFWLDSILQRTFWFSGAKKVTWPLHPGNMKNQCPLKMIWTDKRATHFSERGVLFYY